MVAFTIRGKITNVELMAAGDERVMWVTNGYFGDQYCLTFISKSMERAARMAMESGEDVEVLATLGVRNRANTPLNSKLICYCLICEDIIMPKKYNAENQGNEK